MASPLARAWGPFAPYKGSAAFTATPTATPDRERSNHFETVLRSNQNETDTVSDRSASVDSNATLVDESEPKASAAPPNAEPPKVDGSSRGIIAVNTEAGWHWAVTDRELYHRLQNLSQYPSAVALARRRILTEMKTLLRDASTLEQDPLHIFSLPRSFDETALRDFLQRQHDATTHRFADYDQRRADAVRSAKDSGFKHSEAKRQGMEMFFGDREGAKRWMRRASVVKYVDGAWLQHLLRTTTGVGDIGERSIPDASKRSAWLREQRKSAKDSWQVMSEELGDGDLTRSHVAIYEKNMDDLAKEDCLPSPPKGEDRAFTEWSGAAGPDGESSTAGQDSTGNDRCWRAALAQLSLSVSPNEFLPEAIGWNASYEGLPYHLLVSSRELQELDLDAYYFWLHVSIDNASTGHAAMARECIVNFLEGAKAARGEEYADEMWARIKLGFALADFIPTTPLLRESDVDDTPYELTWTPLSKGDVDGEARVAEDDSFNQHWRARMVDVFKSKAATAHGLHAGVKARIAGESLSHWLDPAHVQDRAPKLLDALASNPVWIVPGKPNDSKFVKEFEWGGKMFGAMTGSEVGILRKWVETLPVREEEKSTAQGELNVVRLPTDDDAEAALVQAVTEWLSSQAIATSSTFRNADFLRPFDLPESVASVNVKEVSWSAWSHTAAIDLYTAVLAHPDCVRTKPPHFDRLLGQLGSRSDGGDLELLSSSSQARLVQTLNTSDSTPSVSSVSEIGAILPTLANILAPLEQVVSISPSRLASPLGMAVIKVLRVLHGFTEMSNPQEQLKNGGDGRETGCMGTEDIENDMGGLWEVLQDFYASSAENTFSTTLSLNEFSSRPGRQLALPSLLLTLSSHFWEYAPLSLGIVLSLCSVLSQPDCIRNLAQASHTMHKARNDTDSPHKEKREETLDSHIDRISEMMRLASLWTERAIQIGLEHEGRDCLPRGVSQRCKWSADVQLGWRLANEGLRKALGV